MRAMRAVRILCTLCAFAGILFVTPPALAAGAGGGAVDSGSMGGSSTRPSRSPAAIAKRHHQSGLRHKAKAWKLEAKAAKAEDPEDREKLLARAEKAYRKAVDAQTAAVAADPRHYEAQNELGYALRKTGRYPEAIAAYDRALALEPSFHPAIEYRGEAYLALGQLEQAKAAYMTLFRNDRKLADQLMAAMDDWLEAQPAGDGKAAFAEWVKERKALAGVGGDLSKSDAASW